jgi:hypothetical protein
MNPLRKAALWACCLSLLSFCAIAQECVDEPPGDVHARWDAADAVKLTELVVTRAGDKAYVATEYLGAANLQATVYLKRQNKYCFAGELGAATSFRSQRKNKQQKYYELIVESKSGSDRFFRRFNYVNGSYVQSSCEVRPYRSPVRPCTDSEQ